MLPQDVIARIRDGRQISDEAIEAFVTGVVRGEVGEGQIAAFAMAVLLRGLDPAARVALTRAMTRSGTVLDWSAADLGGPVLDKHSSGGIGDKVSLILAPIIAACGGFVPMISGRGLGHTGGTLDKFDAIPGYRSQPDLDTLRRVTRQAGCAIVGATADIAPADRIIYGVRDVTATVESLDLITASILSKKLAAGLDGLILDVKWGSGAFMSTLDEARALAQSLVEVADGAGLTTAALITDMNQALGRNAGNAVEMAEAAAALTDPAEMEPRLAEVTLSLAAELLTLGGLAPTGAQAREKARAALESGRAATHFGRMVSALGGPADFLEAWQTHLPRAPVRRDIFPASPGVVTAIDGRALGMAVVAMGGGRTRPADPVDHRVGLVDIAGLGAETGPGSRPLCTLHAADEASADRAEAALRAAFEIGAAPPEIGPVIAARLG